MHPASLPARLRVEKQPAVGRVAFLGMTLVAMLNEKWTDFRLEKLHLIRGGGVFCPDLKTVRQEPNQGNRGDHQMGCEDAMVEHFGPVTERESLARDGRRAGGKGRKAGEATTGRFG